jgi:hypothetical protein
MVPEVRKEQIKLSANLVNTVAAAFIVTGFVVPLVTGQVSLVRVITALVSIAVGIGLHQVALSILEGLQDD